MAERLLSCYDMTHEFPIASVGGDDIREGYGIGLNAAGACVPADHASAVVTLGRAAYITPNGNWQSEQGIFCWANSEENSLTAVGQYAYWEDDGTVGNDSDNNFAGIVYRIDEYGVWVLSRFDLSAPPPPNGNGD